jgi:hypothetical protein
MQEVDARGSSEFPGYVGGATMVVLLALAAESLSAGSTLAAAALAVIAIGCFYVGASLVVRDLERGDDSPTPL